MKKHCLAFLLSVCSFSIALSQVDIALLPLTPSEKPKGDVESYTEEKFNMTISFARINGETIRDTIMDLGYVKIFNYDKNGRLTELLWMNPTHAPVDDQTEYNNDGSVTFTHFYAGINQYSTKTRYEYYYDEKGNQSRVIEYLSKEGKPEELLKDNVIAPQYNSDGYLVESNDARYYRTGSRVDSILFKFEGGGMEPVETLDENGSYRYPQSGITYVYDEQQRLIGTTTFKGSELKYKYNSNGDLIYENMDVGNYISTLTYDSFLYDDHGNWVQRIVFYKGPDGESSMVGKVIRTIKYRN